MDARKRSGPVNDGRTYGPPSKLADVACTEPCRYCDVELDGLDETDWSYLTRTERTGFVIGHARFNLNPNR